MTEIPCVIANDLSDDEIRALRLIDNKTNESPWDFGNLNFEIGELSDLEFDFGDFGLEKELDNDTPKIKTNELKSYSKAHYLLSFDINDHDKILPFINEIKKQGCVEIEHTFN